MFERDDNWNWRRGSQTRPQRRKAAFTLVELLVVISIIGILVGLTMPAVMSAIESARRMSCTNNMKQIALATNQYEAAQRQYPLNWGQVGSVGTPDGTPTSPVNSATSVGVSWLAGLLPYIDQGSLYNQAALGMDPTLVPSGGTALQSAAYVNAAHTINNLMVLSTPINTFLCPSDTQRGAIAGQALTGTNAPYATTNYKACAGSNWVGYPATGLQATSGSSGRNSSNTWSATSTPQYFTDGVDHGNGMICRGGETTYTSTNYAPTTDPLLITGNQDIQDGSSKTILLGESVPAWCAWSLWFWFEGSTATCGIPLNYTYNSVSGQTPESLAGTWQVSSGFMSRHKQGANFASCDGSVRFVPNIIDFNVYKALATIDGNEANVISFTTGATVPVAWP